MQTFPTLADRVDSFPDPWLPEPADKLVGEIIELAVADKGFGPYSLITVFVTESSTERGGNVVPAGSVRVWHAFGTVPVNELKKLMPRVGDRIAVKYFGVRDGRDGPYKAYRIIVERAVPSANAAVIDDDRYDFPRSRTRRCRRPRPSSTTGTPTVRRRLSRARHRVRPVTTSPTSRPTVAGGGPEGSLPAAYAASGLALLPQHAQLLAASE